MLCFGVRVSANVVTVTQLPTATRPTRFSREWLREISQFASIGALAFVVDFGIFNLLLHGPGQVLGHKPITAKIIAGVIATTVAYLGNRYLTFARMRSRDHQGREFMQFVVANLIGLGIASLCLAFSRYILQLSSPLADNIAANFVGLGLGTLFRYVAYKYWVFRG